jgi:hypothetical protein
MALPRTLLARDEPSDHDLTLVSDLAAEIPRITASYLTGG